MTTVPRPQKKWLGCSLLFNSNLPSFCVLNANQNLTTLNNDRVLAACKAGSVTASTGGKFFQVGNGRRIPVTCSCHRGVVVTTVYGNEQQINGQTSNALLTLYTITEVSMSYVSACNLFQNLAVIFDSQRTAAVRHTAYILGTCKLIHISHYK